MDNNERTSFTLSELLSADETIKIPAVQRGSVWNARQVEFLWDSILRGFPVGAFIVRRNGDGYDLLDGQQRYNAIRLAAAAGERAKLWLDLEPELPANSSRKFLVKATTAAHPWGYKNDDACSLLSAEERREALRRAGYAEALRLPTRRSA